MDKKNGARTVGPQYVKVHLDMGEEGSSRGLGRLFLKLITDRSRISGEKCQPSHLQRGERKTKDSQLIYLPRFREYWELPQHSCIPTTSRATQ